MTVASTLPLRPNAAPAGICWDHRLVPLRWSGALKERQPMCLLPRWRLSPAILPIVSRASRTVQGGDDVGGGVVGKLFRECHGRTVAHENKSAMPKIELAQSRHCRHNSSTMKHTAESITALPTIDILPALAAHWEELTGEGMRYWQDTDTHFEIRRDLRDIAAMEAEIAQRKAEIVSNAKTLLARMDKEVAA
jgi:hypothetical protein